MRLNFYKEKNQHNLEEYAQSTAVVLECVMISAMIGGLSGLILGILTGSGYLTLPHLGPFVRQGVIFICFYLTATFAILAGMLGAIIGAIEAVSNIGNWDE